MKIKLYQVDAFADRVFSGNPAAICPLDQWLPDERMQQIAMENNLSETGFFVRKGDHYHIRWFTPTVEVDLCGHATLAAAHVLFHHLQFKEPTIIFESRSGELRVSRNENRLTLDFPADVLTSVAINKDLKACFRENPIAAFKGSTDYMLVFESEADIKNLTPDFRAIEQLPARGVIATAPGNEVDFVSRFFAPAGVPEDPVTGSAHTTLTPYWSKKLNKATLTALQLSSRKGSLTCTLRDSRVEISGQAVTYLTGEIEIGS